VAVTGGAKRPRCVVIGAGLAGLAAALRLTERGWHVDILEAMAEYGGRVYSYSFPQARHLVCELGGEWIGDDHHRMKAHCRQFGLRLQRHRYAFAFPHRLKPARMFPPGAWPFSARERRAFLSFRRQFLSKNFDLCQQKSLDQYDWWSWLAKLGFRRADLLRRDLMDSTDFGETIRLTSAYVAAGEYFTSNDYDEMDWKIVGGNHRLPEEMVKRITRVRPKSVHLNRRVVEIHQRDTDVEVHAVESAPPRNRPARPPQIFKADFCICTVPARSLNRIRWFPELPDDQSSASDQLQYCRIMKTVVLCPKRFWPKPAKGGFSLFTGGVSDFCFDSTQSQPGLQGILCSYAIGDKADDLASESPANLKKWITDDVLRATGHREGSIQAIDIRPQPWQGNPYSQGAYAFYRSGQWFTVRPLLARPHLRVHFAGEHLDEDWQGFMEGAVRTGESAASQL
jgi:monoamine oxidase